MSTETHSSQPLTRRSISRASSKVSQGVKTPTIPPASLEKESLTILVAQDEDSFTPGVPKGPGMF